MTSTKEISVIPTKYNGISFRSRLEARAAVLFDKLGLCWEYEPEGFQLPENGWYLPDFLIKKNKYLTEDLWVECKGKNPTIVEENKLTELACLTGLEATFFVGTSKLRYIYKKLNSKGYFDEELDYYCRFHSFFGWFNTDEYGDMDVDCSLSTEYKHIHENKVILSLPYYFPSNSKLWYQIRDEFEENGHIYQYGRPRERTLTFEEEEAITVIGGEEYLKYVKSWIVLQKKRDRIEQLRYGHIRGDVLGGRFHIAHSSNHIDPYEHRYKVQLFRQAIEAALGNKF